LAPRTHVRSSSTEQKESGGPSPASTVTRQMAVRQSASFECGVAGSRSPSGGKQSSIRSLATLLGSAAVRGWEGEAELRSSAETWPAQRGTKTAVGLDVRRLASLELFGDRDHSRQSPAQSECVGLEESRATATPAHTLDPPCLPHKREPTEPQHSASPRRRRDITTGYEGMKDEHRAAGRGKRSHPPCDRRIAGQLAQNGHAIGTVGPASVHPEANIASCQ